MSDFKVGDRVVIVREDDAKSGKSGVVNGTWHSKNTVLYKGFTLYEVTPEDSFDREFYFKDELEAEMEEE